MLKLEAMSETAVRSLLGPDFLITLKSTAQRAAVLDCQTAESQFSFTRSAGRAEP